MRIGAYIDGYNLYYGARRICGRGTPGWRWLDIKAMVTTAVMVNSGWVGPYSVDITYCTVPVGVLNPTPAYFAGKLEGSPNEGVGGHWWYQLTANDLTTHQLPTKIGAKINKPKPW